MKALSIFIFNFNFFTALESQVPLWPLFPIFFIHCRLPCKIGTGIGGVFLVEKNYFHFFHQNMIFLYWENDDFIIIRKYMKN